MTEFTQIVLQILLVIMVLLLLPCIHRAFIGPSPADRLQAFDAITTLLIGIFLLQDLVQGSSFMIDISMALAAFSLVATIALARYLSEGRVF
jgi:multicomponent Na+:H+ antiporter subunit F